MSLTDPWDQQQLNPGVGACLAYWRSSRGELGEGGGREVMGARSYGLWHLGYEMGALESCTEE